MERSRYLVWCSTKHGKAAAELFGALRQFDVAIHDYGPWDSTVVSEKARGDYYIPSTGTEKLETAGANIASLPPYDYYAFLDDDLEISTDKLNLLFALGELNKLELYQPALSLDSCGSWPDLFQHHPTAFCVLKRRWRQVAMVEVMCPFFSRDALRKCLWSFDLNQSGWGLDTCIWPKLVSCHVIDAVTIRHPGPFRAAELRKMRNGLTAWQEYEIVKKINYDGASPW